MKAKAFVSSTYEDLKSYRCAVKDTLLQIGIEPLMMEIWSSIPAEPKEVSLKKIEECDVFIGIYANRYGYRPSNESKSITELEFDYASKLGKIRYCYIVDED